jgi:vitamin B12 transporter
MRRSIVVAVVVGIGLAAGPAPAQEARPAEPRPEEARPEPPRPVEPVVVTATKVETPLERLGAAVSIVTDEEVRTYHYQTVEDALRHVPGVEIQRAGSLGKTTSIRIRGAGPQQVQVLVDGMRVKSPTLGQADLAELPLDAVERIEVVRGPQSTLYGADAIGGVVNIITRKGRGRPSASLDLEGGSHDTFRQRVGVQGAQGGFNYNVSASHYDTAGHLDNDDASQTAVGARLGYDFPWKGELSLTGRYSKTEIGLPVHTSVPPPTVFDPNSQQQTETWLLNLVYTQPVSSWWDVKARYGYWSNNQGFQDDAPPGGPFGDFPLDALIRTRRREAELINAFTPAPWTTVTVGLEHRNERGDNRGSFQDQIDTLSAFVQDELRFFDRLFLTGSTRVEDSDAFGTAVTSRVSAAFLVKETETKLRAAWGEGFRAPTINDLFFPGFGNPDLQPERSESWEAGLDQRLWQNRIRLGATYFHNDFEDLIQFALVPGAPFGFLPINLGAARTRGVETYVEVEPLDWLLVYVNYTYTSSLDKETGDQLRRVPRHHWNSGVVVSPTPWFEAFAQATVLSSQLESPGFRTDGYYRIDIGGTVRLLGRVGIMERLELTARIDNVTDQDHDEVFGFPTPGISALVGLRARFQ